MPESTALVLYVEDDRINILLMEEAFRRLPAWRLHCVERGAEALAWLAHTRPVFALIDMQLPDMNGIELLTRLRALPGCQALTCVAVSADNPAPLVRAAREAGFADYWLKPVDMARFELALAATQAP